MRNFTEEQVRKLVKKEIRKMKESGKGYYQAHIFFDSEETTYKNGDIPGSSGASWDVKLKDNSLSGLLKKVMREVNAQKVSDLSHDDINNYDWASELNFSYLVDDNNYYVSERDNIYKEWKAGRATLWQVYCHILISRVGESPIPDQELKQFGIN